MISILRLLVSFRVLSPILRPLTRLLVGAIAIPLFRLFLRRVVRLDELDKELSKDLEQWFRGSLLLLVATRNMEDYLFGWVPHQLNWLEVGLRILLAISVIEAMPDVDLFPIIHPGPSRALFKNWRGIRTLPHVSWLLLKSILCRHLDRSSAVFAILAAIYDGPAGWVFYGVASVQFLIIGLVTSRDKAADALGAFDRAVELRRRELIEMASAEFEEELQDEKDLPCSAAVVSGANPESDEPGTEPAPAGAAPPVEQGIP